MASLTPSLRRRAVYAVLSPVLDEEALIAALWLQQNELRGDSVTDIIRFIDKVYHFGYYFGGAILLGGAFNRPPGKMARPFP